MRLLRPIGVLFGILLIALATSSTALAAIAQNDDLQLSTWSGSNWEGPFHATVWDDHTSAFHYPPTGLVKDADFLTFCVERTNYFSNGFVFNIDQIGPITATGNKRLTGYSAWVYQKFLKIEQLNGFGVGTLPTGTYAIKPSGAATTVTWQNAFNAYQTAIWAGMVAHDSSGNPLNLPGEAGSEWVGIPNGGDYAAIGISYNDWLASNWLGLPVSTRQEQLDSLAQVGDFHVMVLDPTQHNYSATYGGGYTWGQDQIVFLTEGEVVPEPATLVVWSLLGAGSWLGMRVWRRRNRPAGRQPWSPENRSAILSIIENKR
jgi:hypothetical protein